MTREVQWIGCKLPMSLEALATAYPNLSKRERDAIDAVEASCSTLIVWPGVTAFLVTPRQGFSKMYKWNGQNNYTQVMTDSDAHHLFNGGIMEHMMFRDINRPDHANREPMFPDLGVMSVMKINDPKSKKQYHITEAQAKMVHRLLRKYRRVRPPRLIRTIGSKKYFFEDGNDTVWYPEPLTTPAFRMPRIK